MLYNAFRLTSLICAILGGYQMIDSHNTEYIYFPILIIFGIIYSYVKAQYDYYKRVQFYDENDYNHSIPLSPPIKRNQNGYLTKLYRNCHKKCKQNIKIQIK